MQKKENHYQRIILEVLGTKPIAFNPDLARVLGSVNAGLILSQLLYWWKKGWDPNSFFKTVEELEEETSLSPKQQLSAIRKCTQKGVISVSRKGLPPKRHFVIHFDNIISLLKKDSERQSKKQIQNWLKTRHSNTPNGLKQLGQLLPNSTESTQRLLQEKKRRSIKSV